MKSVKSKASENEKKRNFLDYVIFIVYIRASILNVNSFVVNQVEESYEKIF